MYQNILVAIDGGAGLPGADGFSENPHLPALRACMNALARECFECIKGVDAYSID
ncbi:hypothetical protein [Rugosibacter aromaticivorans]|uniref:hypothetical protein n=1 Tax=Rugosibacter aromaticivorans TaxID=1565605 RepID=UPI000A75E6C0|nr:hypothetical protein [Rugosibacter aromaticivorans]